VYGPKRELHSGHYGNWAPNPAWRLARLLATMRDDDGRVLIAGYYDGVAPLSETERRALAEEPASDESLKKELLLGSTDNAPRKLSDAINEPSLNIRGISSGAVGAASRNVIPSEATASLDLRLVKGNDYRAMVEKLKAHVRAQGYFVVEGEPDEVTRLKYPKVARIQAETGYNAVRTSMDLPASRQVVAATESARGPVVRMPTSGGSVPLSIIEEVVRVPLISIPIANHDNSQHSANENLRLQNLWDGIETMAALFTMKPAN
jgi:acetylornithine deacetylase/succinyl-diaminopimelate desuccinylase-like protein